MTPTLPKGEVSVHIGACPGSILIFECTVYGGLGGSTVWQGSALDCMDTAHEINLLHQRFEDNEGTVVMMCNNGSIIGRSVGTKNCSAQYHCHYTSQLEVTVKHEMIGKTIDCVYDNGTKTFPPIGLRNLNISTNTVCIYTTSTVYSVISKGIRILCSKNHSQALIPQIALHALSLI